MDNMIGRKKYLQELKGSQQVSDYEEFKTIFDSLDIEHAPSFVRKNPVLFALNLLASINARPVALEAWENIMAQKSTRVHVVTSSNGSVSDPQSIREFINNLPPNQRSRSSQTIIDGENHNIGIVYCMPRTIAWARQAFDA